MPSVSPLATEMLTCCTALTMPRRVANSTVRSLTSSSGCAVILVSPRMTHAPSPRSCGERVGVRGFYQRIQQTEECAENPPHPDRQGRSDLSPRAGRGEGETTHAYCAHRSRPPLRVDDVAQAVAKQVEAEHRDHQG